MKKREEKGDDGQEEVEHELVVIFIFILFFSLPLWELLCVLP
jgi:hypothetical protein